MASTNNYFRGTQDRTQYFQAVEGPVESGERVYLQGQYGATVHTAQGRRVWVVEDRAPAVVRVYYKRQLSRSQEYEII